MKSLMNNWITWLVAGAIAMAGLWYMGGAAQAADLGGNCCADLEERISELEATVAKKGNRKVSVVISGQLSKALVYTDVEDYNDYSIGENSNAPSYLRISGAAKINPKMSAGYVLEIGVGGYEAGPGYGHIEGDTNGIYLRRSYVFLKSDSVGQFSVGKASMASDKITMANTSNSGVASTPLSLRPLTGPGLGEVLEIFDGGRANTARWDSPVLKGFQLSASFAAANADTSGDTDSTVWDVALRYAGEWGKEWKVQAGVAYREGIVIEDDSVIGVPLQFALADVPEVISGSASVKHVPTGLYINGMYGKADFGGGADVKGYAVQGGVEQRVWAIGKTTGFVEYGTWDLGGLMDDPTYWGAGVVQSIDAAAMDIYLSGRKYEADDITDDGLMVWMVGSRIKF